MTFNFKLMFRVYYKSLFTHQETRAQFRSKRVFFLLCFPPIYFLLEIVNWTCLLLDEIFFRSYTHLEVREPVFIVGFPRSGTTFLHRLLAQDEEQFTSMKLWEIIFAPSILQKKFWLLIGMVDRKVGGPLSKLVTTFETRRLAELQKMHKIGLFETEEDEIILIHIFASAFLSFLFPFDDMRPFANFDTSLSAKQRRQIMNFYKQCIQRHLYVFGRDKHFLSKNPAFSCKVQSLGETFPSAKIICTVRTPLEAIPSAIHWMSYGFNSFNSFENIPSQAQRLLEWISHWYTYPLELLEKWPNNRQAVEKYDELVRDPADIMGHIYKQFGLKMSDRFHNILVAQTEQARGYKSRHRYSLDQFGLTATGIIEDFRKIFDRFDFPTMQEGE